MANDYADFKFYHYDPSLAAAIVFIALFSSSTAWHAWQLSRNKTWFFIPFLIGGCFEFVGYIGRAISSTESPDWTLVPYIIQSLLLLLAPALFAASIYMVLSRIILLTDGEKHSLIRARWLTKIFVTGDIFSFLVQSSGGGVLAKAKNGSDQSLGENIILAGLIIQLVAFGFFIMVCGIFHYRISMVPTLKSQSLSLPWQRYLFVLYAASGFIIVRSIFRVIEYVMGQDGQLLSTEIYLYIFDATLMFLAMVLFNIWHPSNIISRAKTAFAMMETLGSRDAEDVKVLPHGARKG